MSVPNLKRIAQFVQKLLRRSQNLEIRSRDPGHAHLGVVLYNLRSRGPFSISVPNLKRITLFVQKLLGGCKISKLGHVPQAMPIYGSFYIPYAAWLRSPSHYQL